MNKKNYAEVQIPALLGLLATHSYDQKIYGVKTILYEGYTDVDGVAIPAVTTRIANGAKAYEAMIKMRNSVVDLLRNAIIGNQLKLRNINRIGF